MRSRRPSQGSDRKQKRPTEHFNPSRTAWKAIWACSRSRSRCRQAHCHPPILSDWSDFMDHGALSRPCWDGPQRPLWVKSGPQLCPLDMSAKCHQKRTLVLYLSEDHQERVSCSSLPFFDRTSKRPRGHDSACDWAMGKPSLEERPSTAEPAPIVPRGGLTWRLRRSKSPAFARTAS
jgi:hypothetical protein